MGNKLSAEQIPQHVKALRDKPDLQEPVLEYYTAGWRRTEFDGDAQEFGHFDFATFQEVPYAGYEADDEQEQTTSHNRADRNTHKDDFKDFEIRRGRCEERSAPRENRTWKERKHSPSAERRLQEAGAEAASDRCNGCRPKAIVAA